MSSSTLKNQRLYIIGNGFDLHHGLETRYSDFGEYLEQTDSKLYHRIQELFHNDELWSDFEATLAELDYDSLMEDAGEFLTSIAAEDWNEGDNHGYQEEIHDNVQLITVNLMKSFARWINQIDFPNKVGDKKLTIEPESLFVTFNYTNTLERYYSVLPNRILYIHGKSDGVDSALVLGHGRNLTELGIRKPSDGDSNEEDFRIQEGDALINAYFKNTQKDTRQVIRRSESFLTQLSSIREIYVLGHSMADVDMPYFEELVRRVSSRVNWVVSYHADEERVRKMEVLKKLGIEESLVKLCNIAAI